MAKKHCSLQKRKLFNCSAFDSIHDHSLSLIEHFAVLMKKSGKKDGAKERAGLAENVELAVGMLVIVMWNVHTELDIANGARGEWFLFLCQPKMIIYHVFGRNNINQIGSMQHP